MQAEPVVRNMILNRLSERDLDLLRPHLVWVELAVRRRLADADRPIDTVYFLDGGIASHVASVPHEPPVEIGMIGREGVVNLPILLGVDRSPSDTYMQVAGQGNGIAAAALRRAMERSPPLQQRLLQYAHVFMVQNASTVLANGRATLSERLARWILMAHDRGDGNGLALTHEFLAIMLGVRRSGVSVALRELERRGMIEGQRGLIVVLDREGLVAAANGYYGIAEAEMQRVFGAAPDG